MSQPTETIRLNCHVLGDILDRLTPVTISLNAYISDLRIAIVARYQQLDFGRLEQLTISKVDFSVYDIPDIPPRLQESLLINSHRVRRYWGSSDPNDEDRVHVLVRGKVVRPRAQEQDDTLSDLPYRLHQLEIRQQKTVKGFREGNTASQAATHFEFEVLQRDDDAAILNARPYQRTGLPVQLFHPVFDTFAKALESSDALPSAKYAAVEELLHASQAIYMGKEDRWSELQPFLSTVLSSTIVEDSVPKCEVDGVVMFTDAYMASKAYCAIIEVKNEIGTGECDPSIQGAESFGIYWSQAEMTPLRKICCCPSLIIAIAGPWMCILGAVFLYNPVVQPLTDYIWLGHHPQQDRRLAHLTRVFHAASVSIVQLQEYYKSHLPSPLPSTDSMRFFPYVRQYPDSNGNIVNFDYLGPANDSSVVRPVFKATTNTGQDVVVKFAERYSIEAHRMLASRSLAPRILFYKADFSHGMPHMIVMEEVPCTTLDEYIQVYGAAKLHGLQTVRENIREALDILHGANLVFGDMRAPNILVHETDDKARGMLVDFDWCGKENVVRYPAGLNTEIRWADGVEKGGLILKQHDLKMFEKLFSDS